jgi:ribosomal protein S12 methylthiotransferase RimO
VSRSVALITLGCARNEVDSEELAGRLEAGGWQVADDPDNADAVMVNTCGFIDAAKRDSIEQLLDATDEGRPVIAVGCLAERYGDQLAAELPEVSVLGFDDYGSISDRVDDIVAGLKPTPHRPRDRRALLPITPVDRAQSAADVGIPGHAGGPQAVLRRRLADGPVAPLKLASGCDRRCAFCAIPSFRGSFVSRRPEEVLAEAQWLASTGVREVVLVSENSTSYGKDFGDLRALEQLLPRLAATEGIERVRVSYLQPAEMRPSLVEVMTSTPGVAAYFDLSFQHASEPLLRRMRRFGGTERFLDLIAAIRSRVPGAGVRSNVIVGFPGETDDDVDELQDFLTRARLDAIGVFGYSDEEGTEAEQLPVKVASEVVSARVEQVSRLADELVAQRAEDRVGDAVEVIVESTENGSLEGRAEHQAPEVDGGVTVEDGVAADAGRRVVVGDMVRARVTEASGVDLIAVPE